LLAQQEVKKTLETLSDISSQAENTGRIRHLVEIYLLKAVALNQLGNSEDAIEIFEKCLDLAEPEGYLRLFLESGESLPELLRMDGLDGKHKKYISKLMAALSGQRGETTDEALFIKVQGEIIEPLTKRELEVLRLMCEGLSNQDIADQLIVSINTVKKHTSNVYAKLGVRNRAQAVLRAREIELV
jgi:LuxR family maltose regulon positive regulatory protein